VGGWASQLTSVHLIGAVLLSCFLGYQNLGAELPPYTDLVVALDGEIRVLAPYTHHHKPNAIIDGLVHDQLFFRDPKTLRPVPNLAESLKPVDDVTWDLKLRPSIRFHNGEPVDAAAVKFTIDRILQSEPKSPYYAAFSWVKEVEVTSELAVRLHGHRPVPSLPDFLTRVHVLPPRYLTEVGEERFAEAPVGAGPYRFDSRLAGGSLMLKANGEYWGGPKGRPSIRQIIFSTVMDPVERFHQLLQGKVHIARGLTVEQGLLLDHSSRARRSAKPTPRVVFLQMDGDGRASKTPLVERRVRRAMTLALPIDDLIDQTQQKLAVRTPGGLTPLHFGYDQGIQLRRFDLPKARELLSDAGFTDGFELPLNFSPAVMQGSERLAASIMDSLGKVGVKTKIRRFDDAEEFTSQSRQGKLEGLSLLAWGNGASFDADAIYYPLFHSGQAHAYNTNPEFDKLLDEGRATIDPEKRKAIYSALQKLLGEQAVWIPLYGQYVIEGVNRRLDYEASSDELMNLSLATWRDYGQTD
jgi:peptide/nickel transport system substrate-binding protein